MIIARRKQLMQERQVSHNNLHITPPNQNVFTGNDSISNPLLTLKTHPRSEGRIIPKNILYPFDSRDKQYVSGLSPNMVPPQFSLRSKLPYVLDRIDFGSASAAANVLRYEMNTTELPSANMLLLLAKIAYCKVASGDNLHGDSLSTRYFLKIASKYDVAPDGTPIPSREMFTRGMMRSNNLRMIYRSVSRANLREVVADKHPVIFNISVYPSFLSGATGATGQVVMPDTQKESPVGFHTMIITGFNDLTKKYEALNSWDSAWGDKGFCYIPYEYFDPRKKLVTDMWMVEMISADETAPEN